MEFYAVASGRRYEINEVIDAAGEVALAVRVDSPADRHSITWIRNGAIEATDELRFAGGVRSFSARPGDWFSVLVRRNGALALVSSPIYVERRQPM